MPDPRFFESSAPLTLEAIGRLTGALIPDGAGAVRVDRVAIASRGGPGALAFVTAPAFLPALAEAPPAAKGAALTTNGSPGGAARVPKRKFGLGTGIGIGPTPNPVMSPRAPSRPRPAPGTMAVTSLERSLER